MTRLKIYTTDHLPDGSRRVSVDGDQLEELMDRNQKTKMTIKSKSELMRLHLLAVEAVLGHRIDPKELTSSKFTESRDAFVRLMTQTWKG